MTQPRVVQLCRQFLDELYAWNARINLTSVPAAQAWQRHIEEAADLLGCLPQGGITVADLGSGCGVPGIPIAIARSDVRITLIESDSRKAGFLVHAAGLLHLSNVSVETRRAEEMARSPQWRAGFDAVVSRAAAAPDALCELALPLIRAGGVLCALVGEGRGPDHGELVAALGGGEVRVVGGVLMVRKDAETPDGYPRRSPRRWGSAPARNSSS